MDEMLTALETLTTPEATQYLDLIASPIDPALKETLVYLRLPNTPALVVKGLYDGHASQLASLTSQAKYQEKVEAQITEAIQSQFAGRDDDWLMPERNSSLDPNLVGRLGEIFRWSKKKEDWEVKGNMVGGVMALVQKELVKIEDEVKKPPKKSGIVRVSGGKNSGGKNSGGKRTRKKCGSQAEDEWVVGDKEALTAAYDSVENKTAVGWFCKADKGLVFQSYDKRFLKGEIDPRLPRGQRLAGNAAYAPTLQKDLVRYRWKNCIRATPFWEHEGTNPHRCKGAVKWKEGMAKGGSQYCKDNEINQSPMVMCSKAVSQNPDAKAYGLCDCCFKKNDYQTFFKGTGTKKGGAGYTFSNYFKEDEVIAGEC